jgi:hypothetical protein
MKRNTILTSAVAIALGCGGTAAAQDTQECANSAMKLSAEIAQSTMANAAKAEFMKDLSEAQGADFARCSQVVARVQLAAGTTPDEAPPAVENAWYEKGHASADAALATHPGAAANDRGAAGVSASGEVEQGYASPQATMQGDANAATKAAADKPIAADNTRVYEKGHASADAALLTHPGAATNDSSAAGVSASGEVEQGYASPQATMAGENGTTDKGSATNALSSMSAADLIDKPVQNAAGEKLGEIDAIVTGKTGSPPGYAVIGSGGMLGFGGKQVLVHLDQLQVAKDGTIQLPTSDQKDFDAYPEYIQRNFIAYDGAIAPVL